VHLLQVPNNIIYDTYVDEESYALALEKQSHLLQTDWNKHIRKYPLLKKKMINSAKKLASVKTNDNKKIVVLYKQFLQDSYNFCEFIWSAWAVIACIEKSVSAAFPDTLDLILSLDKPIVYMQMLHDLHIYTNKELVEKYAWQKIYSSFDEPYHEEDFESLRKENTKEYIEEQFRNFTIVKRKFKKFIETIADNNKRRDVCIVHTYAFLKTDRIDSWKHAMFYLRDFHNYLASLAKISLKDAANMTTVEIFQFLESGKIPSALDLRSKNKVLYYYHNNSVEILTRESEIAKITQHFTSHYAVDTNLKGITACKGKVKGPVKVIHHSNELDKVKEGDVFVAKYTFPRYTTAMLKCVAIVTDEGGLTTHAAIIARENNIPCIVGTKRATTVLKEGDIVEVDADKGVIIVL
jgi:phosphohistidine swiveling domain-containing protein